MSFTVFKFDHLPDAVKTAFQPLVKNRGVHTYIFKGRYYYMLSLGQRPNPAYGLSVSAVEIQQGKTIVKITEVVPEPGVMVIQVISYPHLIGVSLQPVFFVDSKSGKVIS